MKQYLEKGMQLLEANAWESQPSLTYQLNFEMFICQVCKIERNEIGHFLMTLMCTHMQTRSCHPQKLYTIILLFFLQNYIQFLLLSPSIVFLNFISLASICCDCSILLYVIYFSSFSYAHIALFSQYLLSKMDEAKQLFALLLSRATSLDEKVALYMQNCLLTFAVGEHEATLQVR